MNWRRGLFRLWIVGTALFVLAIAFVSYSEIKAEFDAVAGKREAASILATYADRVHQRFYSDMPREQRSPMADIERYHTKETPKAPSLARFVPSTIGNFYKICCGPPCLRCRPISLCERR